MGARQLPGDEEGRCVRHHRQHGCFFAEALSGNRPRTELRATAARRQGERQGQAREAQDGLGALPLLDPAGNPCRASSSKERLLILPYSFSDFGQKTLQNSQISAKKRLSPAMSPLRHRSEVLPRDTVAR